VAGRPGLLSWGIIPWLSGMGEVAAPRMGAVRPQPFRLRGAPKRRFGATAADRSAWLTFWDGMKTLRSEPGKFPGEAEPEPKGRKP
jgi:hypothetical protein